MKMYRTICILLFVLFIPLTTVSASKTHAITPGIILDEINEKTRPLINDLKKEFKTLLLGNVTISDKYILSSDWSSKKAVDNYNYLLNNLEVNFISTCSGGKAPQSNQLISL